MKIQNLSIIFLVIAIPLIMLLSYYLDQQQDTLKLQTEYDLKLASSTKEAIRAFEINTVEWSNTKGNSRDNAQAAINTFIKSLSNNLNISGTVKEYMTSYIPAVAVTMYDGYYIYAPTYVPVTVENEAGVQLFYNERTGKITTKIEDETGTQNLIMYQPKTGATQVKNIQYEGESIKFVTNIANAKTEYKHTLSNEISYSERYRKASLNVVVNYTLDNRIYVYGNNGNGAIEKDGYLVYFDSTSKIPRIHSLTSNPISSTDLIIDTKVSNLMYNNSEISTENLSEQILYKDNDGTYKLGTYSYVYDIENEKLYYDNVQRNFFTLRTDKSKSYLDNSNNVKVGGVACKYKSVSVLWGNTNNTTEYKKIYQVLNGADKGKWYINLRTDLIADFGMEEIDTQLSSSIVQSLGLPTTCSPVDYSAINYYVEAYAFTNWVKQNLGGEITQEELVYNETTKEYETNTKTISDIFSISSTNNPEDDASAFVTHKKEIMKNSINSNLNLSISNYNDNSGGDYFNLPVLTDSDWEQIFSNISIVAFFQGVPIGLKYYNNYAIATSTDNREYVDSNKIYLMGADDKYHRVGCNRYGATSATGYLSIEYSLQEFTDTTGNIIYYYPHDNTARLACYYCITNRANYKEHTNDNTKNAQYSIYKRVLARERYFQKQRVQANIFEDISINVTKKFEYLPNTSVSTATSSGGLVEIYDTLQVSSTMPIVIEVTNLGTIIERIQIDEYPNSSVGTVIRKNGKIYLDLKYLAEICNLTSFKGLQVNLSYFI